MGCSRSFSEHADKQHPSAIKEQYCAQGLVLRRGGHVSLRSQIGEVLLNLGQAHISGMALVVKQDKAFGPSGVGFLGPD